VIAAPSQDAALAAKAGSATMPVIFNVGGDPVRLALVASLKRTVGNATGVSMFSSQLESKRACPLQEMAPAHRVAGLLINPTNGDADNQLPQLQTAARALGMRLRVGRASADPEIDAAFESLVRAGAKMLLAAADPFLASRLLNHNPWGIGIAKIMQPSSLGSVFFQIECIFSQPFQHLLKLNSASSDRTDDLQLR
jgi:putative ABC transport system substrate-binding protein